MSGLILIVMLVVMVVVLFVKLVRQKPVKNLLISYAVILGGYHLLVSSKCGPDRSEVKIMKPQAEVVTNYILKHGIPKSLADIPNLPYPLVKCERESHNYEKCDFYIKSKKYDVDIYELSGLSINVYSWESETGILTSMNFDEINKKWILLKKNISYSSKNDGICNPMRM